MATKTGIELAATIRATLAELKKACADVDEATASRAPAGRWSPKEILSHLLGPEQGGGLALFETFAASDLPHIGSPHSGLPRIDIVPEQTHFTEARRSMSFAELAGLVERKYEGMAAYALGLGEDALARRAHIPLFKDSPLTEHPTLAAFLGGFGQYHVQMHLDHLRQVLAELAAK